MAWYANIRNKGTARAGQYPFSLGVLDDPKNLMPVGHASGARYDDSGVVHWRLWVKGQQLPDLYLLIDGEFIPVNDDGRQPR